MMKFSMALRKHNRATVGRVEGHNTRLHQTSSQLPKAAWFSHEGRKPLIEWREKVLDKAKELSRPSGSEAEISRHISIRRCTGISSPSFYAHFHTIDA